MVPRTRAASRSPRPAPTPGTRVVSRTRPSRRAGPLRRAATPAVSPRRSPRTARRRRAVPRNRPTGTAPQAPRSHRAAPRPATRAASWKHPRPPRKRHATRAASRRPRSQTARWLLSVARPTPPRRSTRAVLPRCSRPVVPMPRAARARRSPPAAPTPRPTRVASCRPRTARRPLLAVRPSPSVPTRGTRVVSPRCSPLAVRTPPGIRAVSLRRRSLPVVRTPHADRAFRRLPAVPLLRRIRAVSWKRRSRTARRYLLAARPSPSVPPPRPTRAASWRPRTARPPLLAAHPSPSAPTPGTPAVSPKRRSPRRVPTPRPGRARRKPARPRRPAPVPRLPPPTVGRRRRTTRNPTPPSSATRSSVPAVRVALGGGVR